MPLKSKAQAEYLRKNKPELYKEFSDKTPKGTKLPDRAEKPQKAQNSIKKVKKI
jgi:hypothetical protein